MCVQAQEFKGLNPNLGNLYRLSDAKTRSISPENITGEKGKGGGRRRKKAALHMQHVIGAWDGK